MFYGNASFCCTAVADTVCFCVQPDITWVGGITEARRVVQLAAAYDIPVIPHGSSVFSYHLQFAFANCPMAEFLVLSPQADTIVPLFGDLYVEYIGVALLVVPHVQFVHQRDVFCAGSLMSLCPKTVM
jgi:hypothetical protein